MPMGTDLYTYDSPFGNLSIKDPKSYKKCPIYFQISDDVLSLINKAHKLSIYQVSVLNIVIRGGYHAILFILTILFL